MKQHGEPITILMADDDADDRAMTKEAFDESKLAATTGWGQDEDRRKSADAGFDAHLVKPLDPCALARVLAELAQPGAGAAPTGARGN